MLNFGFKPSFGLKQKLRNRFLVNQVKGQSHQTQLLELVTSYCQFYSTPPCARKPKCNLKYRISALVTEASK